MMSLRKILSCLIGLISLPLISAKGGCTSGLQQKGYINGATYSPYPVPNVNSMAECVDKCTTDSECEGVLWASKQVHSPMISLHAKSCLFMTTAPSNVTIVPTVTYFDDAGTTHSFDGVYYCIMDYTSQCSPNVCKNGAPCVEDVNGGVNPECSCSQAGPWYSGKLCQTINNTGPILHYTLRKSNIDVTADSGKVFPLGSVGDTWSCAFSCYKSEICVGFLYSGATSDCMGVRSKPTEPEFTVGHYEYYDRSDSEGGTGSAKSCCDIGTCLYNLASEEDSTNDKKCALGNFKSETSNDAYIVDDSGCKMCTKYSKVVNSSEITQTAFLGSFDAPFTGKRIIVDGTVWDIGTSFKTFTLNIVAPTGDKIMHFDVRMTSETQQITRNSKIGGSWLQEQNSGGMPINIGQRFKLEIIFQTNFFQIDIDGAPFATYNFPVAMDFSKMGLNIDYGAATEIEIHEILVSY